MAIGLGYGEPAGDLMERKPRPLDEQILPRALLTWLVLAGLVLGGTALGVIWWAEDEHGVAVARTMGLTTFAIANVFFAYAVKDRLRSIFSVDTFADRRLLLAAGLSGVAILFGTELQILNRILGTVSLTGQQWVVCLLAAAPILVASELQKLLLRRRLAAAESEQPPELALGQPVS
jgi:Ca2+-transporting ATPase